MRRIDTLRAAAVLIAILLPGPAFSEERPLLRVSIENTKNHIQAKSLFLFRERVLAELGQELEIEIHTDGKLFRDRDVLSALHSGKVEMAVPGIWNLEPKEPNFGVFLLPFMYGRKAKDNHLLADGAAGREIGRRLERHNDVEVLGGWLDLGNAHVFTLKKRLDSYEDLKGLTIRVAGGRANELRLLTLGARTASIPWADLVANLGSGRIDGLLTTYETVASAKLWNYGIRNAFEDNEYFPMYIPLVSRTYWNRLKDRHRTVLRESWNALLETARKNAAEAQETAKRLFLEAGGKVTIPQSEEIERAREILRSYQDDLAARMRIDPAILDPAILLLEGRR